MSQIKKYGDINIYFDLVQGTQEWLDVREGRITCSNALTLLNKGKNAALEANRLAANRITPNGNVFAERGHVIEHEMKDRYNNVLKSNGLVLVDCGFITNDKLPNAGYSPDGLICTIENGQPNIEDIASLAEFKAYNDVIYKDKYGNIRSAEETKPGDTIVPTFKHRKACFDILSVPPQAIAQCNMAMLITETESVYLFLCNPDAAETDKVIEKLRHSTKPSDQKLLEGIGPLDQKTPTTKIWEIKRNKTICDRLMKKLSH